MAGDLSPVAAIVRRHDRERFLTALFAPADRREALFALYAFNYEIARVREVVSEPMLGQMRLQWWRDSIEGIYAGGAIRRHEVVEPLAAAIRQYGLERALFDALIDAREADLTADQPATLDALLAYCESTSSRLLLGALEILELREEKVREAVRQAGLAYALAGLVRALPFHARARRLYLPADLMREAVLKPGDVLELRRSPALQAVIRQLAEAARGHLAAARIHRSEMPKAALAALLPATLADLHLRRLARAGNDPFEPRLATPAGMLAARLALAAATGRY